MEYMSGWVAQILVIVSLFILFVSIAHLVLKPGQGRVSQRRGSARPRARSWAAGFRPREKRAQALERRLASIAFGDRERMEALIDYERRRLPNRDREFLMQAAVERWERDNNR